MIAVDLVRRQDLRREKTKARKRIKRTLNYQTLLRSLVRLETAIIMITSKKSGQPNYQIVAKCNPWVFQPLITDRGGERRETCRKEKNEEKI